MKNCFFALLILLILISTINVVNAVPAPFNEYYYNPVTNQCNRYWRGDEHGGGDVIPEGFYFSGHDDVNCTEFNLTQFNMTKYQECKLNDGKYLMKGLLEYECSFEKDDTTKVANGNTTLYITIGIVIVILLGILFFRLKKSKMFK